MRNKLKIISALSLSALMLLSVNIAAASDSWPMPPQGTAGTTENTGTDTIRPKQPVFMPNRNTTSVNTSTEGDDGKDLPGKVNCTPTGPTGLTCVRMDNGLGNFLHKLEDNKKKDREDKISSLDKLYQNQISEAQDRLDRLENVLTRIIALRAKMTSTDTQSLAALDALITKASSQKDAAEKALQDLKDKSSNVSTTLSVIQTDTSNSVDTSTSNISTLKQTVQQFQLSVKDLKKQLIAFQQTLMQTIKQMKIIARAQIPPEAGSGGTGTSTNSTSTSTDTSAGGGTQ